jgi:carbon-monoxide dehydrogenase medium subunit
VELTTGPEVRDGFGVLPRAAKWIGHYPIRSRGTVGGSIAHSDPTAEWCLLASLFDAKVVVLGPEGIRVVPSHSWFTGFLTTSGEFNEMVVEVRFNRPRTHGALTEYSRRRGDFAIAAAAVAFDIVDGRCHDVSIVLGGVATEPLRLPGVEAAVEGAMPDENTWIDAAKGAAAAIKTTSGSEDDNYYRRHLVDTLTRRAFAEALETGSAR